MTSRLAGRLLAVLLLGLVTGALAEKCAAPPLKLAYRNASTVPGVLSQGIPIQLGSPWQQAVLTPSLQLDGTFIPRFTNTCVHNAAMPMHPNATKRSVHLLPRDGHPGSFEENGGGAEGSGWEGENWWVRCAEVYGGAFSSNLSTSFHDNKTNNGNQQWWFNRVGYKDWSFVTETWRFADYLDGYAAAHDAVPATQNLSSTFMMANQGALFGGLGASALGLGTGSALLGALAAAHVVPSTSWALTNSSLCLGCIDAGASSGLFQTFKPADRDADPKLPCLVQAKVMSLTWRPLTGGEGVSLIQSAFTACIDPGVKFLVLPTEARSAFEKTVNRDVKGEFEDYVAFKGPPKGDMGILTFRLDGGLVVNITIPGTGKVDTGESGEWKVPIGKGGWGAYGNETWTLGKPFTDRVVLRWDGVKKEYGIANVNDHPSKEDIQPLGCDDFPKVEKSVTSDPGTGVIVGAAVGGVVGGLFFAMAGLWFFKRGQKGVKQKYEPLGDTLPMRAIPSDRQTLDSYMTGARSPPPTGSIRESLRSQMSSRAGNTEPQLVADNALYEAPEGGTAFPTKRERAEMQSPDLS